MKFVSIAAKPGQNRLNRRLFLAKRRKNRRELPKTAWRGTDFGGNFAQKDFTVKELDPETGFYYYGARYLDPRTSRWLSGDPAIGEYLPQAPVNDEAKKGNGNLPGQGGVFNLVNLHVYHYAGNNPVKYVDPDGRYDRGAAVAYAHKWYGGTYAAGRNSQYYNYGQNCANFVSQALFAGKIGMSSQWHSYKSTTQRHDDSLKNTWDVTTTWSVASEQFDFFSNPDNGYIDGNVLSIHSNEDIASAINDSGVQVGDLLYFGEGENMHSTIITNTENGDIKYSANTKSRKDEFLTNHLDEDNIRIIRIKDDAN